MAQSRFSVFDIFITFVSLFTLILDVGTDILVTVLFFLNGDNLLAGLMTSFIVLPLLFMNIFSLKWHVTDGALTWRIILPHMFLMAPVQRYLLVFYMGVKSRQTNHPRYADAALREMNDICILRLVNAFMESAPQLILQLSIIFLNPLNVSWMLALSAASSLLSLAWSLTAYCDSLRLVYQTAFCRRFLAVVLQCASHLLMVAARVAALVAFTLVFRAWVCMFAGLHCMAMIIWIAVKGTDFGSTWAERWSFRVISGFIYIFVFLNLHDGPARSRMVPYYCLVFLENAALYAVWIVYGNHDYMVLTILMPIVIFGGFLLGGLFLMIYYRWLHPSGPNYLFTVKSTIPPGRHRNSHVVRPDNALPDVTSPQCVSILEGNTLELSTDGQTPERASCRESNSIVSQLLHSSTRGALESAWQSGMNSSGSSSSSSLNEEDCSMDEFNTTARSNLSVSMQRSRTFMDTSQSHLSVVTVLPRRVSGASISQRQFSGDVSKGSNSGNSNGRRSSGSVPPQSPTQCTQHNNQSLSGSIPASITLMDHESISEEQEESHSSRREAADGIEEMVVPSYEDASVSSGSPGGRRVSMSRVTFAEPNFMGEHTAGQEIGAASVTVSSEVKSHDTSKPVGEHQGVPAVDASFLSEEPESQPATPSLVSYSSPDNSRPKSWLSHGVSCNITPGTTPRHQGKAESNTQASSCSRPGREGLTPYPDLVESMAQDRQHPQRLFDNDSYNHAGGESMWGASPSSSNTSSSQSQDTPKTFLPSKTTSPLMQTFACVSEPACTNTTEAQGAEEGREDLICMQSNRDHHSKNIQEQRQGGKKSSSADMECSWTSMNVNADELSGLNNLQNLTPDNSMCSFASNNNNETSKAQLSNSGATARSTPDSSFSIASALASPALSRSKSTSSIYHDFCTEGFPPTPLAGLKGSGLSRNSSWLGTPELREPGYGAADMPWHLDYLNLDCAPPVEENYTQRYDPREVIIELLLDQLQRTRSNRSWGEPSRSSPLHPPYFQSSPLGFGRNSEILRPGGSLPQRRENYRSEFLQMKEGAHLTGRHSSLHYIPHVHQNCTSERYVSGHYRPPLVTEGKQHETSSVQYPVQQAIRPGTDIRTEGRSKVTSCLGTVSHPGGSSAKDSQRVVLTANHQANSRRRSMPVQGHEGLHRYFLGSDSPTYSPHWNTPAADGPSQHQLLQRYLSENVHSNDRLAAGVANSRGVREHRSNSLARSCERSLQTPLDYTQKQSSSKMEKLELLTDFQECQALAYNDAFSHLTQRQPLQSLDNSPSLSPNSGHQQPVTKKASIKKTPDLERSNVSILRQEPGQNNSQLRTGHRGGSLSQAHRHSTTATAGRRSAAAALNSSNPPKHVSKTKSADCLR